MKIRSGIVFFFMMTLVIAVPISAYAKWDDIFKKLKESVGLSEELSNEKIIDGLKEALNVGTEKAVDYVSKLDGYYKNPDIKIPLPETVQKVEKVLRTVGTENKWMPLS